MKTTNNVILCNWHFTTIVHYQLLPFIFLLKEISEVQVMSYNQSSVVMIERILMGRSGWSVNHRTQHTYKIPATIYKMTRFSMTEFSLLSTRLINIFNVTSFISTFKKIKHSITENRYLSTGGKLDSNSRAVSTRIP